MSVAMPETEVAALREQVRELEAECAETRRLAAIGATMRGFAHSVRGAQALCLAATAPEREEEIRKAATTFLESEEAASSAYASMLRAELKTTLWRIDGLPEFEAEALEGGTLSLGDFKGKVTLLDFWNPG